MQHVIYYMRADDKSPIGIYTNRDWFLDYKWIGSGVTFVPQQPEALGTPEPGDVLWFSMAGHITYANCLLGLTRILSVEPGLTNSLELYYDSDAIIDTRKSLVTVPNVHGVVLIADQIRRMDALLAKLDSDNKLGKK